MILPLTDEDKIRLKKLSQSKDTVYYLKKLFINAIGERPASNDVSFLAAQRIAFSMLYDIFHDLEVMHPDAGGEPPKNNIV